MSAQNMLHPLDQDIVRSPACKRARYEMDSGGSYRWTLTKNELVLDSVYDSGVGRLDSDSENELDIISNYGDKMEKMDNLSKTESTDAKLDEIAVLQAVLHENTLHKLSVGELDKVILKRHQEVSCSNINYFNLLSDEVVLHIFKKLTKSELGNVALVCRRFNQLAQDESLWTRMDVSNKVLDEGALGIIMSRQVIILRLARSQIHHPPILPNVKAYNPEYRCRLMYLDLTMASASPETLTLIFSRCRRLKKVSLESVAVNSKVLTALSTNKDIEVINLAMSPGIDVDGLESVLTNCRNIREINLSWTYLSTDCISYICENLPPTMDRLNMSGCRKLLEDEHVTVLVRNCAQLRELDLSDCTSITGDSIRRITALEELNFLSLSRCYAIPYRSLLYLKRMKNLTYLDIHGGYIDEEEMKELKEGLGSQVNINKFKFSSIARPTVGTRRSSIWNMRIRD